MTRSRLWIATVSLLSAATVGAAGWGLWAYVVPDEEVDAAAAAAGAADDTADARAVVEARFPHGLVNFGKVFVHGDGDAMAVCGHVDIDEADDNFDGPERFVFEGGELTLEEADGSEAVTNKWRDVCEG